MLRRLALVPLFIVLPFLTPIAQAKQPSGPMVFALLVNNHLVAVRGTTGAVLSDRVLASAPVPKWRAFRGYYLALSRDRKFLYALVLTQPPARDQLAVVDVATTRVERRYALARGIVFRSVAVGPVSGRIYLFGNRAGDVVVTVLDPRTGTTLSTWTVRRGHGVHWVIYRGSGVEQRARALYQLLAWWREWH